ncbi:MAG: hypothetical protein ACHQ50_04575 [Fimbriimonadales bacterium]
MEALIAVTIAASLMIAAVTLYGFVSTRLMTDGTHAAVLAQANRLADEMSQLIGNSKFCDTASSGSITALRCRLPNTGVDTNADGLIDRVTPATADAAGTETYKTGTYVWFYQSDATGAWGNSGSVVWRARPVTSSNPAAGDLDAAWSLYYSGGSRWNFIDSITFTNDPGSQTTTFTINASSLNRAERSASALSSGAESTHVSLTRTVHWRYARNLIVNGSFEFPAFSGNGSSTMEDDGLPGGWITTGNGMEFHFGGNAGNAHSGNTWLDVASDRPSGAQQTIITTPGKTYVIAFWYSARSGIADNRISVWWDGNQIDLLNGVTVGWVLKTYTVTASGNNTVLKFLDASIPDAYTGMLDTVAVLEN